MMRSSFRVLSAPLNMQRAMKSSAVQPSEVVEALDRWGKGLVAISQAKATGGDYVSLAKRIIEQNYAYDFSTVLFKPTLASQIMFRGTFEGALSYFVANNPQKFPEDGGFALNPWTKVGFDTTGIITGENHAIVMGNKLLTNNVNQVTVANFTMGFIRVPGTGELKINLHHSSLPYSPAK
eukprot:gene16692-11946_t